MDIDDLTPEQQELLKAIQARRKVVVREHRLKKGAGNNQAIVPRRNDPRRISNTANMKVGVRPISTRARAGRWPWLRRPRVVLTCQTTPDLGCAPDKWRTSVCQTWYPVAEGCGLS